MNLVRFSVALLSFVFLFGCTKKSEETSGTIELIPVSPQDTIDLIRQSATGETSYGSVSWRFTLRAAPSVYSSAVQASLFDPYGNPVTSDFATAAVLPVEGLQSEAGLYVVVHAYPEAPVGNYRLELNGTNQGAKAKIVLPVKIR